MKTEIMEVCNQEMKKKEGKNKGFSLVELIVVIAIMAILAIVVAPQVMKYIGQSRSSADATIISLYQTAVNTALADEAAYTAVTGTSGLTITISSTDITYSETVGAFKTEFENIINLSRDDTGTMTSKPALPKSSGNTTFLITIPVKSNKIGAITVVPAP